MTAESQQPTYQLLRPLSDAEYAALKNSIEEHGVLVPIELDEKGRVLDGHHRQRACRELGVKDYPTFVRAGLSEAEKRAHILTLNADRRHLTAEDRDELIRGDREQGKSIPQIEAERGVSRGVVQRAISTLPGDKVPDRIVGKDGKSRPARRPTIFAANRQEEKRALEAAGSGADLPAKVIGANRGMRLAREHRAELRAEEAKGDVRIGKATLLLGDMRERGEEIPDESVDLVFTDPPYPQEFLSLWSDLSALAARVLKPNGMLIAYTGAMYLPEVMTRLAESLSYWWAGAIILGQPHSKVHARNVNQTSKPLLFFVKPGAKPAAWIEDTYRSEGAQKDGHDWQQSIGCASYYIGKLLSKSGTVLDPFLGAGTTGRAALDSGCDFIGIDNDPKAFAVAQERLAG